MKNFKTKNEGFTPPPKRELIKSGAESADSRLVWGFTLVEILVVASLIAYVTTLVLRNFSSSRLNLERVANVVASDIRLAQQLALSSHQHQGPDDPAPRNRCGYGITNKPNNSGGESTLTECSDGVDNDGDSLVDTNDPGCIDSRKYSIYAGPSTIDALGNPVNCASTIYQQSQDFPYYKSIVLDLRVEFETTPRFQDIFYMPPGPTTYIQNQTSPSNLSDPTTYYEKIIIRKSGMTQQQQNFCRNNTSPDCINICVYYSGRVEVTRNPTCPTPY